MPTLKQQIGCWIHERWQAELALRFPRIASAFRWNWLDLCNRHERLTVDKDSGGRICHWSDSSPLTVARMFPDLGSRLIDHCLQAWPIQFNTSERCKPANPDISIVIGVRGTGRLPQFKACLASLRAQTGADCEVIVVEQSCEPEFQSLIPSDIQYIHQQSTHKDMPFNRSWALNCGVFAAKGRVVLLHDADMLLPARAASQICERLNSGLDAVRLARFIFYLDQHSSQSVQETNGFKQIRNVDWIVQNNPTPVALKRDTYFQIGGHDESFYGWGAEDLEFMDRLRTTKLSEGAFLPIVHLWHEEAPNRSGDRNAEQLQRCRSMDATDRITKLGTRPFGQRLPTASWQVA